MPHESTTSLPYLLLRNPRTDEVCDYVVWDWMHDRWIVPVKGENMRYLLGFAIFAALVAFLKSAFTHNPISDEEDAWDQANSI